MFVASPTITNSPQSKTVVEGARVTFSCSATGHPLPTITWMHNGMTVSLRSNKYSTNSSTILNSTTSTLTLLQATAQDSGMVTCLASVPNFVNNERIILTDSQASAHLNVLGNDS